MIPTEGHRPAGESSTSRTPDRESVHNLYAGFLQELQSQGELKKKADGWFGDIYTWFLGTSNAYYEYNGEIEDHGRRTKLRIYEPESNQMLVDVGMVSESGERVVLYLTPESASWLYPHDEPDMYYSVVFEMPMMGVHERPLRRGPTQQDIATYSRVLELLAAKHR